MYSRPAVDADVVSQAIYASNVGLLEEKDDWIRVRTADQYTGWMPASSLRRLRASAQPRATQGRAAQVESLFANLYREASVTRHAPLVVVPYETRLEVVAEPDAEQAARAQVTSKAARRSASAEEQTGTHNPL